MKRFLVLLVVAIFTLVVIFFFINPGLLDKVWLWLIGFIGYILILLEKSFKALKDAFGGEKDSAIHPILSPFSNLASDKGQIHLNKLEQRILQIEQQMKLGGPSQHFSGPEQKDPE